MPNINIKFKYKFDKGYNPKYVTGAFGGISPRRDIVINFFLERQALPISQTYEINNINNDSGKVGNLTEQEPSDIDTSIIRFIETGIVMNLETAKVINEWLSKQITELENIKENI